MVFGSNLLPHFSLPVSADTRSSPKLQEYHTCACVCVCVCVCVPCVDVCVGADDGVLVCDDT